MKTFTEEQKSIFRFQKTVTKTTRFFGFWKWSLKKKEIVFSVYKNGYSRKNPFFDL